VLSQTRRAAGKRPKLRMHRRGGGTRQSSPVLHEHARQGGVQQRAKGPRRQHQPWRVRQHAADLLLDGHIRALCAGGDRTSWAWHMTSIVLAIVKRLLPHQQEGIVRQLGVFIELRQRPQPSARLAQHAAQHAACIQRPQRLECSGSRRQPCLVCIARATSWHSGFGLRTAISPRACS
jgi:hypothetical protein